MNTFSYASPNSAQLFKPGEARKIAREIIRKKLRVFPVSTEALGYLLRNSDSPWLRRAAAIELQQAINEELNLWITALSDPEANDAWLSGEENRGAVRAFFCYQQVDSDEFFIMENGKLLAETGDEETAILLVRLLTENEAHRPEEPQ